MNSTQEFIFQEQIDYEMVSFKQVDYCLCTPARTSHVNCKAHKNPDCPYSCSYELPVGDALLFLIVLGFVYASFKFLKW
jgi:hypothetical protein